MGALTGWIADRERCGGCRARVQRAQPRGSVLVLSNGLGRAVAPVAHRRLENALRVFHTLHTADDDHFSNFMISESAAMHCFGWAGALDPREPDE